MQNQGSVEPARRLTADGRRYFAFTALNITSVALISRDLIALLSVRLGAGPFLLGAINSLSYFTFGMIPLGRLFIDQRRPVRHMVVQWRLRYLSLSLAALALFGAPLLPGDAALAIYFVGLLGFFVAKGFGMTARGPIVGHVSDGGDRESFLSRVQLVSAAVQIVARLGVALLLGADASRMRFAIVLLVAVAIGSVGSFFLARVSEPSEGEGRRAPRSVAPRQLIAVARRLPRLLSYVVIWAALSGIQLPFIVLFFRSLGGLGDNGIMLGTAFGSVIALAPLIAARRWMATSGAGRFLTIAAIALVLASGLMLALGLTQALPRGLLLAVVAFGLFRSGQEIVLVAGDSYLLDSVERQDRLDAGMIYQVLRGVAGVVGSFGGGAIMSALDASGRLDDNARFAALWSLTLVLGLCLVVVSWTMHRTRHTGGPATVANADLSSTHHTPRSQS